MRRAASFRFALASTMQGLFPPSSSATGVSFGAAFSSTSFPTLALPVKKMKSNFSSSRQAFSLRPPVTTATYSLGKISPSSDAISALVLGE